MLKINLLVLFSRKRKLVIGSLFLQLQSWLEFLELLLLFAAKNMYVFLRGDKLQIPSFVQEFEKLKSKGVDGVYCVYIIIFLNAKGQ